MKNSGLDSLSLTAFGVAFEARAVIVTLRRVGAALVVCVLSAACLRPLAEGWARPGVTPETLRRDIYECRRESTFADVNGPTVERRLFRMCMESRGYTRS